MNVTTEIEKLLNTKGKRPSDILTLARLLNIPGKLIKVYPRSGRECREYIIPQLGDSKGPWHVVAFKSEHNIIEE